MNTEQTVIVTKAEERLCMYMRGIASNSTSLLIKTIFAMDDDNRAKMALGFPDEVNVIIRYKTESGYWQDLVNRWNIVSPGQPLEY